MIVFVAISLLLARVLGAANAERDAVVALAKAEARGDAAAVDRRLDGCLPKARCAAVARDRATHLRRAGDFHVLRYDGPGGFTLGSRSGRARIAWKAGSGLPIVQCMDISRTGDPVSGYRIRLRSVSPAIVRDAAC